jgi:hypothetical protein
VTPGYAGYGAAAAAGAIAGAAATSAAYAASSYRPIISPTLMSPRPSIASRRIDPVEEREPFFEAADIVEDDRRGGLGVRKGATCGVNTMRGWCQNG